MVSSKVRSYSEVASKVETIEGFMVEGQDAFLFEKVQSLSDSAVILEIGAFKGRSSVNMGYACVGTKRKVYSMDTWTGNQKDFHITDYEDEWKTNITSNGLEDYVLQIKGDSKESLKNWEHFSGGVEIDFVFIDGSHVLEDVFADFQLSFSWLKPGGWVAFHDVEFTHHDVVRVWNDVAYPILINHEYSSTISCGQKRTEASNPSFLLPQDGMSNRKNPTCLFVDTYYQSFIEDFYKRKPKLATASYQHQINSIQSECFGDSDFYSAGLRRQNWQSENIIFNCQQIQAAWVRESDWDSNQFHPANILIGQIREVMPDVVYFQDISILTKELIEAVRPFVKLIVGQIACPVPQSAFLKGIDIIFTSFPHYVDWFRDRGVIAYYQPLAFSPNIPEQIKGNSRDLGLTFVGGISGIHSKGTDFLNHIANNLPISIYGYGASSLHESSPIKKQHRGEAWGLDMFKLFARSFITLNRHVDVAQNNANNMRLFESTGCGTLLITDYKDNLGELFKIGEEVVAYRSPEECVALVEYFLKYPDEAKEIAEAGQKRTLKDHTYDQRMEYTAEILEKHLRYQNITKELRVNQNSAEQLFSDLQPADSEDMTSESESAWTGEHLPLYQRQFVQKSLESMYSGTVIPIFRSLVNALQFITHDPMSILDVGCSSGYYKEVIDYLLPHKIKYVGVDVSRSMVNMARDLHPNTEFQVSDGANLPYSDKSFSTILSSGVLLHVNDVSAHVAEMCRVAEQFIVLNRTDIVRNSENRYHKKRAYGADMVDVWYNEQFLVELFLSHGFRKTYTVDIETNTSTDHYLCTYVFERTTDYRPNVVVSYDEAALDTDPYIDERWQKFPILLSLDLLTDLPADFKKLNQNLANLGQKQINLQIFNKIVNRWIQTLKMTDTKEWFLKNIATQGWQRIMSIQDRINISYSYFEEKLSHLVNWLVFSEEHSNFTFDLTPLNMKHLAWTLVPVTGNTYERIRSIITEVTTDKNLERHIISWLQKDHDTHTANDPIVHYGRTILWYVLARIKKPKVIVQSGIHRGMGTCVLSSAVIRNKAEGFPCHLYAIDIAPDAGALVQPPYNDSVERTVIDSLDYLESFKKSIDLFIGDINHPIQRETDEYQVISSKLSKDSIILSNTTQSTDALPDFAVKTNRQFTFFQEAPAHHFSYGNGIGIAYKAQNQK